ncbi:MAG: hypothetical protein ACREQD_05175, partial [Candidatus Binataceae bacterium]
MHLKSSPTIIACSAILTIVAYVAAAQPRSGAGTIADRSAPAPLAGRHRKPRPMRTPAPIALPPDLVIPRYPQGVEP